MSHKLYIFACLGGVRPSVGAPLGTLPSRVRAKCSERWLPQKTDKPIHAAAPLQQARLCVAPDPLSFS